MNKITKGIIALALGVIVAIPIMGSLNKSNEIKEETKITESVKDEEVKESVTEEKTDQEEENDTPRMVNEEDLDEEAKKKVEAARAVFEKFKNGEITQAELQEQLAEIGVSVQNKR